MKRIVIIAIAALFLAIGFSSCGYNTMVSKEEAVSAAVGNLQTAYQKRADLIPNLVATVKNYAEYESGTLTAVVEARAKATQVTLDAENLTEENLKAFQAAQDEMSGALSRLLVTVEQYPDLKANQNYLDLQSQLEGCENSIANSRNSKAAKIASPMHAGSSMKPYRTTTLLFACSPPTSLPSCSAFIRNPISRLPKVLKKLPM